MAQVIDDKLKQVLLSQVFWPTVANWNRLEGRPRQEDFDRSLRAEIRDPLWMICRQWQFGEFKGEDAGSAIKAKVQVNTARLSRYAGRSRQAVSYDDSLPLETKVEREVIPFDLMTRAQMGLHWFKLLDNIQDLEDVNAVKTLYHNQFGFKNLAQNSEELARLHSNRKSWQTFELLKGRVVDGGKLYHEIHFENESHEQWLTINVQKQEDKQKILATTKIFEDWFERVYSQPNEMDDPAWADAYLEYQFACSAPANEQGDEQTVLVAEQYYHGHLDWYSVDVDNSPGAELIDKPDQDIQNIGLFKEEPPISFIPNPIEFAGMPNIRWWEFEDQKVNLGNINPNTSDLATLLLAEFGLIYGNDWSLVPYPLEAGTLSEVQGVVVTDVFGVRTLVQKSENTTASNRTHWGMYYLSSTDNNQIDTRLFLPPTVGKIQESTPLEKVTLTRDEMANMVWGIEDVIPDIVKGGTNGYEAATDLARYLSAFVSSPQDVNETKIDTAAEIEYTLGTQVPENWIPFIPVHNPGSNREIRLQRAAMPRLIPGIKEDPVQPRGVILKPDLEKDYFLNEEEVSKTGVQVTRSYQRVRWWDGKVYTWLGRRKLTARNQDNSGLEFDRVVPISQEDK